MKTSETKRPTYQKEHNRPPKISKDSKKGIFASANLLSECETPPPAKQQLEWQPLRPACVVCRPGSYVLRLSCSAPAAPAPASTLLLLILLLLLMANSCGSLALVASPGFLAPPLPSPTPSHAAQCGVSYCTFSLFKVQKNPQNYQMLSPQNYADKLTVKLKCDI